MYNTYSDANEVMELVFVLNRHSVYNSSVQHFPLVCVAANQDQGSAVRFKADSMNIKQYKELSHMVEMAEENQGTLRFGAHYFLKEYLKKNFGIKTGDNPDTIRKARRLLDEFLTAYTAED
jgi:hypothetical protein